MTAQETDRIKMLVKSFMACLLQCDSKFEKCWNGTSDIDKREILLQLEDTVYIWSSDNRIPL